MTKLKAQRLYLGGDSAALDLGVDRLDDLLHGYLRIGLFALEISLPDRLADDELIQAEQVVVDRLGLVKLAADQSDELGRSLPVGRLTLP